MKDPTAPAVVQQRLVRLLSELLCNYECDTPYDEGESPPDMWPWEKIEECLKLDHCGDCVNVPATCPRCFVEDVLKKATWISERLPNIQPEPTPATTQTSH